MSAAKALRLALARAAEKVCDLPISVTEFEESRMTLSGLTAAIPETALHVLIQAPDGAQGLLVLDCTVLAGLIEQMTTGAVRRNSADDRRPTPTDAIIASELIDATLALFEDMVQGSAVPPNVGGYRYDGPFPEVRAITLTLDDQRYRFYRLTLDLGHGAKSGEMILMLPLTRPSPDGIERPSADDFRDALEQSVRNAEATMTAVLHRFDLPLEAVMAFEVGTLVPVPRKTVGRIRLEGVDGKLVAQAHLGQANGQKAVRVRLDALEDDDDDLPMMPATHGAAPGSGAMLGGNPASDFPAMDDLPAMDGDFPAMGDLPPLGDDLPPMGELPPLGDLPAMGDLPPLGDFPAMGDLPPLTDD